MPNMPINFYPSLGNSVLIFLSKKGIFVMNCEQVTHVVVDVEPATRTIPYMNIQ